MPKSRFTTYRNCQARASIRATRAIWIAKFREAFEQIDYRVLEHIDCGENVVTVVEATGTGTGSGVEGTVTYAQVETWRDGKIMSIRYFTSKEAALEAAGLRE